ncbi:hypothetical protein ABPG75_002847 [Micractinium tetrahymenae]
MPASAACCQPPRLEPPAARLEGQQPHRQQHPDNGVADGGRDQGIQDDEQLENDKGGGQGGQGQQGGGQHVFHEELGVAAGLQGEGRRRGEEERTSCSGVRGWWAGFRCVNADGSNLPVAAQSALLYISWARQKGHARNAGGKNRWHHAARPAGSPAPPSAAAHLLWEEVQILLILFVAAATEATATAPALQLVGRRRQPATACRRRWQAPRSLSAAAAAAANAAAPPQDRAA